MDSITDNKQNKELLIAPFHSQLHLELSGNEIQILLTGGSEHAATISLNYLLNPILTRSQPS